MKYDYKKNCCIGPQSVNISVTEKCGLRCPICFQDFNNVHEVDYNKICTIIDELHNMGTSHIQFSGGEPLLYPQLDKLISYAKRYGMIVRISTSGLDLSKKRVTELVKAGLDYCHISLNGSKREIHELTRDGYDIAISAINLLKDSTIKIAINWIANHSNIEDLPDLVNFAKKNNVEFILILSNKNNNQNKILYPLTETDIDLLKKIVQDNANYILVDKCFVELANKRKRTIIDGCRAGRFFMAITASHEFLPCPHLYNPNNNYDSVEAYWNNDELLYNLRAESIQTNFTCEANYPCQK